MTKVIIRGKSGQPLEHYFTWPLACSWGDLLFCHPFLIVPKTPVTAGMGFTISTKSSNSPAPRQLFLLPPPSETNRFYNVDWWDEYRASLDDPSYSIKLKNPSQFPHPKQYPLKPEGQWGLMPIINSLELQGLLISYSSPYNKFKILIKVNFKIQVTK
jgi:hypothetical protein